jgi:Uncharacterized conserved protein
MSLGEKLEQDYITAYKARDAVTLSVLRLLKTALKNHQVEHMKAPDDAAILDIISRQCKQRQDSIDQFTAANRHDLADKEAAELLVLRSYMPAQLSAEELLLTIDRLIAETGASSMKDMGRVMQALTAAHKGQFDGKAASEAVKAALHILS